MSLRITVITHFTISGKILSAVLRKAGDFKYSFRLTSEFLQRNTFREGEIYGTEYINNRTQNEEFVGASAIEIISIPFVETLGKQGKLRTDEKEARELSYTT